MGHIVVGVDESASAAAALRWAAAEAAARGWSLTAVLAWGFLDQHHAVVGEPFDPAYGEADAVAALDAIVIGAVGAARAATVDRKVVCDRAARALLGASAGSDLLVLGARGLGGFRGLLLGSVSQQCLQHATCPVAVLRDGVRDAREGIGRIVVGIDGSDTARRALEWALEEGRVHQATVEVVHASALPYGGGELFGAGLFDPASLETSARHILDQAVESADTSGLPAPVARTVTIGPAATAILEAAEAADLVVVGSRGLGGFKGALLGSVSHHLAHRSTCPVVVVPATVEGSGS
jgi:nucleotide-binding universal stress UspA family protein